MLLAYTINYGGKQILILISVLSESGPDKYKNWTDILEAVSVIGFFISFLILIYVFRGYVTQEQNPYEFKDGVSTSARS